MSPMSKVQRPSWERRHLVCLNVRGHVAAGKMPALPANVVRYQREISLTPSSKRWISSAVV